MTAAKVLTIQQDTWANYTCRGNLTWNQVISNSSALVNNMTGAEVTSHNVLTLAACFPPRVACCSRM